MHWFVGDIHGCSETFTALLKGIAFNPDRDSLWLLGDLVNKGPNSLEVLRIWQDVGGQAVVGNHDAKVLRLWSEGKTEGKADLDKLFAAADAPRLLGHLSSRPLLQEVKVHEESIWLVHAGIHPHWKDLSQTAEDLNKGVRDRNWWVREPRVFAMNARCCSPEGKRRRFTGRPEGCPEGTKPWDAFYHGKHRVIHGHWAMRGFHRTGRVIGLDAGCVYGGSLVAWSPDQDRVVEQPLIDQVTGN